MTADDLPRQLGGRRVETLLETCIRLGGFEPPRDPDRNACVRCGLPERVHSAAPTEKGGAPPG